jgi:AraC family transcriptional regulator
LVKLAVEVQRALERRAESGVPGGVTGRVLAHGHGWTVQDVVCTAGPDDQPFEEQHSRVCIALVVAGSFQYRSGSDDELMTPGSLLLGSAGQPFECAHEYGAGDRCLSFQYAPDYFARIAADAGARGARLDFRRLRVPPLRAFAPVAGKACAGLARSAVLHAGDAAALSTEADVPWEELSVDFAAQTVRLVAGLS